MKFVSRSYGHAFFSAVLNCKQDFLAWVWLVAVDVPWQSIGSCGPVLKLGGDYPTLID